MTSGRSCRVSIFVSRNDRENIGAEASMINEYQLPLPDSLGPTTIRTPTKPISAAAHRSGRIFSPSR